MANACTLLSRTSGIEGRNRIYKYAWNFFTEPVAPLDLWQDRRSKPRVFTEVWGRRMSVASNVGVVEADG